MKKMQLLGQFMTTNYNYILQNITIPLDDYRLYLKKGISIITIYIINIVNTK